MTKYNIQALVVAAVVSTVVSGAVSSARVSVAQIPSGDAVAPTMTQEAPPPMEQGAGFVPTNSGPMFEGRPEGQWMPTEHPTEFRGEPGSSQWHNGSWNVPMNGMWKGTSDGSMSNGFRHEKMDGFLGRPEFGAPTMERGDSGSPGMGDPMHGAPHTGEGQGMGQGMGPGSFERQPRNEMGQWKQMEQHLDHFLNLDDDQEIDEAEAMITKMEEMLQKIATKRAKLLEKKDKAKTKIGKKLIDRKLKALTMIETEIKERLAEFERWLNESDAEGDEGFGKEFEMPFPSGQ